MCSMNTPWWTWAAHQAKHPGTGCTPKNSLKSLIEMNLKRQNQIHLPTSKSSEWQLLRALVDRQLFLQLKASQSAPASLNLQKIRTEETKTFIIEIEQQLYKDLQETNPSPTLLYPNKLPNKPSNYPPISIPFQLSNHSNRNIRRHVVSPCCGELAHRGPAGPSCRPKRRWPPEGWAEGCYSTFKRTPKTKNVINLQPTALKG